MTTGYDAPIGYDSDINYDGGPSVVTSLQLPTWHLEVLNPFTLVRSPLPEAKIDSMSFESSAVSALSFTVAQSTVGASLCNDLAIVELKANGQQVKDGRWILRGAGWNEGTVAKFKQFTGRHLLWDRLEHTVVQPGVRKLFTTKTPGYILNELFADAQARDVGFFDTFTWDFTATLDSNGNAWPTPLGSLEYLPTAKYSDIVGNLVDKGVVEIALLGNEIVLTVPSTDGVVTPALLVVGKDVTDAPQQSSADNLLSDVVVLGDDGITVVRENTETRAAYWREEGGISQGGTKDVGTLSIFGDVALSGGSAPRVQRTYGLVITQDRPFLPLRDYSVGDWVRVQHAVGGAPSYRVKQVVFKREKGAYSGTLVLNDKFLENELRLTKKVDGIIGGATITGSAQTSTPDADKDTTKPNPPTGTVASTQTYVDDQGRTMVAATISTNPPLNNVDGSLFLDPGEYRLAWKYTDEPTSAWRYVQQQDPLWYISPLEPGRNVTAIAAAIDSSGNGSLYSDNYTFDTAVDTTPPPAPAGPFLSSMLRMFIVEWNGLTGTGGVMPSDFHHIEVWSSAVANFTPELDGDYHGTMVSAGQMYITAYGYSLGTEVYFKFVAVDNSGNRSVPGTENWRPLVGVVGNDVVAGTITANHLGVGSVTAQAINAGAITADKISLGGTQNLVADPSFNNADWRAQRLTTKWCENPTRWFFKPGNRNGYYLQALSVPDGTNGGRMYITDWIFCQLGETYYAGIYMKQGEFAPSAAATIRLGVEVTYADGTIESDGINYLPDTFWQKYGYRFIIQNPVWTKVRFFVRADNISAGDIVMDDWEVRSGVGTTEYSGSRGLLDNLGLFAWDSAENNTFSLDFRTGDMVAKGSLQSGFSGKRTIVNPGITNLPEIRFYPTSGDFFGYINSSDNADFPFVGVNAPDINPSANCMVLYDNNIGWIIGQVTKIGGVAAGAAVNGWGAGTAAYIQLTGRLGGGASGNDTFSSYVFKNLTPTGGAGSNNFSVVLTKPPAAVAGQWILIYSLQRNAAQRFFDVVTAITATTEQVSLYASSTDTVLNPVLTTTPFQIRHVWIRSDGDA